VAIGTLLGKSGVWKWMNYIRHFFQDEEKLKSLIEGKEGPL